MTDTRGVAFVGTDVEEASLSALLARSRALGATFAVVPLLAIERALGAPRPTAPLEPPPENGMDLGLLELEHEVLQDEYDLARATLEAERRVWQASVSLDAAAGIGLRWREAGVPIRFIACEATDVDFAERLARALGAEGIVLAVHRP